MEDLSMTGPASLPRRALSVRQPWAWAIMHAGKNVENRTRISVRRGNMMIGGIAIHAAGGMTQKEYEYAAKFIKSVSGLDVPRPCHLPRGGIVGAVNVVALVEKSLSPWFVGPVGLLLDSPRTVEFIPCSGQLGYFAWKEDPTHTAETLKWMMLWGQNSAPIGGDGAPSILL
jgi:hypothetical protein